MKLFLRLVLVVFMLVTVPVSSFAGEKEEIDLQVAYWQEHLKVLQLDFEVSQNKLREVIAKKQELDKKVKEEPVKAKKEVK